MKEKGNNMNPERIIRITEPGAGELDVFERLKENQLFHINEPGPGIFIAESPNVIRRALYAGYEPVSILIEEKQLEGEGGEVCAMCPEVPVYTADFETLSKLTGFNLTRGLLCAMKRKTLLSVEETIKNARRVAYMEDVVNPTNVGAIFRSAAALGIDAVLLSEASSDPLYRRAARVSMGTVFQVPWTVFPKDMAGREAIEHLNKLGFKTAAMALSDKSVGIDDPSLRGLDRLAIVLGTEGEGLKQESIDACDYTVKIPMSRGVDSLNVAAASAVAFWELTRQG